MCVPLKVVSDVLERREEAVWCACVYFKQEVSKIKNNIGFSHLPLKLLNIEKN